MFGGFAPNSSSADTLSRALGNRTVMSGSVSRSKTYPSQSLQMMERPLMTPDELKSLPKGDFIVMKTGVHPMRVRLKLFKKWGIKFDENNHYKVTEHGNRNVRYADKNEILKRIVAKYTPEEKETKKTSEKANADYSTEEVQKEKHFPPKSPPHRRRHEEKDKGNGSLIPERNPSIAEASEVKSHRQT